MSLKTDNPYDDKFKGKNPPMMQGVSHLMGSIHRGRGLDFGNSEFDKGLNWAADIDDNDIQGSINEYRAQNQPWAYKLGAGVGRAVLKAGSEIAKLPGVIVGSVAALGVEDGEGFDMAFNNAWIRSIDKFSEESKQEYLPVYVKKAVSEGNLWDNISSIDFWATDGADGIGFIAAMIAPGAIIEGLNVGSKLVSSASKLAKTTGMMDKVRKAEGILGQVGANISKITPKGINSVASVTANTIFEAGAEAKSVSDSITADADRKLKLGQAGLPGGITQEQYDYIINVQRPEAMRDTFITNAAILVGPNAIMHKALWGKGADKLTRTTDTIKDRIVKAGNRYAQATASEGFFEEGLQTTAENYFKEKALKGELGSGFEMKDIGDFAKSYIDTVSSTEGQKAIFLGGVLGGGMTSFQGRKADVKNRENTNKILDEIDSSVSAFNNTFDNDIYLKKEDGTFEFEKDEENFDTTKRKVDYAKVLEVAKSLGYTEEQSAILDIALRTGNTEVINNIKEQAIFNLVLPAIHNGKAGLEALKEKLDSDSQFQEILERDQTSENKTKTVDFKNKVLEQASYLQAENEKFKNFSKEVITLNNDEASESDKEDYLNILNANYLNAKNKLFTYNKDLKDIEAKRNSAFNELGIDPLYNSQSEFPVVEMKGGVLNNDNMYARAEKTKTAIENNSLIKELDSKYNNVKSNIEKIQKDISEIWKGEGKVETSFNNFIKDRNDIRKKAAELEPKINQALTDIGDISNSIELQNYENNISEELKPYLAQRLAERKLEINEIEKEDIDRLNEEFEKENENNEVVGNESTETLTTQISDVENHEQTSEINPKADVVNSESQNNSYKKLHYNNYRIISKEQETGKPLSYVNKEWIDYENTPSDKVGTELHFSLNESPGDNKNLNLALQLAKGILNGQTTSNGIISSNKNRINSIDELREFLANHLPLDLGFKDSQTKGKLDTLNGNASKDSIFKQYVKTARLQIVNHILEGGKLEDITTNIVGQMPGVLQINLNEDGSIPESKITNLNYFQINNLVDDKGNLTSKGFSEIRDRLSVVVDFSNLQNANGEIENLSSKTEGFRSKGEFYIRIPMANGQDFYLKLNSIKIPQNKAEVIYEIYKYRFASEGVINKGLTLKEVSKTNPELIELIKTELKQEYDVISKIKNQDDITLKDVIDIIIYDNNTNDKVKFNFTGTGVQGKSVLEYGNNTIDNLEELEAKKDELIEWITSTKRQNIRMGSPKNIGGINTNSKDYLDYLINNNILNTNAVTFDKEGNSLPTFGGYTNIYWKNLNIKNKRESEFVPASEMTNGVDIFKLTGKPTPKAQVDTKTSIAQKDLLKQFEIDNNEGNVSEFVVDKVKYYFSDKTNILLNQSTGKFVDNLEDTLKIVEKFNSSLKVKIAQKNIENIKNNWGKFKELKPITSNQSDIEAKKADIERRRQNSLNEFKNLSNKDLIKKFIVDRYYHSGKVGESTNINTGIDQKYKSSNVNVTIAFKYIYYDKGNVKIKDDVLNDFKNYLKKYFNSSSLFSQGFSDTDTYTSESFNFESNKEIDIHFPENNAFRFSNIIDNFNILINAKYDAELAALENKNNLENILVGQEITAKTPGQNGKTITAKILTIQPNKLKEGLFSIVLENGQKVSYNEKTNSYIWVEESEKAAKNNLEKIRNSKNNSVSLQEVDIKRKRQDELNNNINIELKKLDFLKNNLSTNFKNINDIKKAYYSYYNQKQFEEDEKFDIRHVQNAITYEDYQKIISEYKLDIVFNKKLFNNMETTSELRRNIINSAIIEIEKEYNNKIVNSEIDVYTQKKYTLSNASEISDEFLNTTIDFKSTGIENITSIKLMEVGEETDFGINGKVAAFGDNGHVIIDVLIEPIESFGIIRKKYKEIVGPLINEYSRNKENARLSEISNRKYSRASKKTVEEYEKATELSSKTMGNAANDFQKDIDSLFNLILNNQNEQLNYNNSTLSQNNITFSHQIDGTEENKQVKEMESKIESKQLNLSEEKIMEFIEEDGFGLLIERYSQEKQIKEDDLTTEDYNKIIESNYTKEQIDKICKN